ncbi:hypothetical protein [Umezawaea sp. NPDC059074]|uniref:hypothetical protein n=1 Tax=Umezawaea sp. NPDC059074 TaxID=3346716 RepID=UPI0036B82806
MTQPPQDPYSSPYQPVNYPQAGPQPGAYPPGPQYQVGMRGVDQNVTAYTRPGVVLAGFFVWLLLALSWPLGTLLRVVVAGESIAGFGTVMGLFFLLCVGIGGVVGAIMFLRGSYHARLGLCGAALIFEIMAIINLVSLSRATDLSGAAEAIAWLVVLARLVLPPVAVVVSLLPGTRQYFAANLG